LHLLSAKQALQIYRSSKFKMYDIKKTPSVLITITTTTTNTTKGR
jgi:hypothetical protein